MEVSVRWTPPERFDGVGAAGTAITMASLVERGGTGAGLSPMETVLIALAGCSGEDIAGIRRKMRIGLQGLTIHVSAERAAGPPRLFYADPPPLPGVGRGT